MKPLKTNSKPADARGGPKSLLVYVEDDDSNWRVALAGLSQEYNLLRARNSEEAFQLLKDHESDIYAVLMDIELQDSDLNGLEVAKAMRGVIPTQELPDYARNVPRKQLPVVFVTAFGEDFREEEYKTAGSTCVIPKPVNLKLLSRALSQLQDGNGSDPAAAPKVPRE